MNETDKAVEEINTAIATIVNRNILKQVAEKPNSRLLNLEETTNDTIKDWLKQKHSSTWAVFSISSEDSLEKAARWFQDQLDSFYTHFYLHGESKE